MILLILTMMLINLTYQQEQVYIQSAKINCASKMQEKKLSYQIVKFSNIATALYLYFHNLAPFLLVLQY